MKKSSVISALLVALAFAFCSCERDQIGSEDTYSRVNMVEKSFSAGVSETKTYFDFYTNDVRWSMGDIIRIYGAHTNTSSAASSLKNDRKTASFTATVAESDQLYAIYPYAAGNGLSGEKISFSVSSSQTGTFSTSNIAVAKEEDGYFNFHNATAVLYFKVNRTKYPDAAKVRIEPYGQYRAPSDLEYLSGTVTVDMSNSSRTTTIAGSSRYVTATLNAGEAYVSLIPQVYRGLVFYIQNSSGKTLRTVTYTNTLYADAGKLFQFDDLSTHIDEYSYMQMEQFTNCNAGGQTPGASFNSRGSAIATGTENAYTDQTGWTMLNCCQGDGCLVIGDGTNSGYAITPALRIDSGVATVSFDVANLLPSSGYMMFSIVGDGFISKEIATITSLNCTWTTSYKLYICGANLGTKLKFYTRSATDSYYLDNVKVIDGAPSFSYLNIPQTDFILEADQRTGFVPYSTNSFISNSVHYTYVPYVVQATCENDGLHVVFNPNETEYPNDIVVTLRGSSVAERQVHFTQLGKTKVEADKDSISFLAAGETKTSELTLWNFADNRTVTAASNNSHFTTMVNGTTLSITAAENTGDTPISGKVIVTASDFDRVRRDTIVVYQPVGPIVSLNPASASVAWTGDTLGVKVTAENFEGTVSLTAVSSNTSAFTATPVGNDSMVVYIPKNETASAIEGTITVTASDGTISKDVIMPVAIAANPDVQIKQDISFKKNGAMVIAATGYYGDTFSEPTISGNQSTVVYSITPDSETNPCASIDASTGKVTLNQVNGTAVITAIAPTIKVDNITYIADTTSYTLTVKRLPQAYAETASLSSNGTRHIETGYVPYSGTRVVVDYQYTLSKSAGYLFGALDTDYAGGLSSGLKQYVFNMGSAGVYIKYGTNRNSWDTRFFDANRHVLDMNGSSFTLDGAALGTAAAAGESFTCPQQLFIFYCSKPAGNTQTTISGGKAVIYSFKIYNGETLVHDYVPCIKNADDTPGLFDLVSPGFLPMVAN